MAVNLTFSGAGFLGIYHVGVVSCLKLYGRKFLKNVECYGGASAGGLAACMLLCDMDLEESVKFVMRLASAVERKLLGPFSPSFDPSIIIKKMFLHHLVKDAYKLATGKLHISLTRVSDWKNFIVSEFHSNEELVDALVCSSFIPFFSGVIPWKFQNEYYIDGGFTDNLPQRFDGTTITVSPFCGESDICPDDGFKCSTSAVDLQNLSILLTAENIYRMSKAVFPPTPEVLSLLCKQGFKDTLKYLHTHYPDDLEMDVNIVSIPSDCDLSETFSDIENTIAKSQVLAKLAFPEKLEKILKDTCALMKPEGTSLCWYFITVVHRMVQFASKPGIYMTSHIYEYMNNIVYSLLPKVKKLSEQSYYTKKMLHMALDMFHAYQGTTTFQWHPSLSRENHEHIIHKRERLVSAGRSMVALPKVSISSSECSSELNHAPPNTRVQSCTNLSQPFDDVTDSLDGGLLENTTGRGLIFELGGQGVEENDPLNRVTDQFETSEKIEPHDRIEDYFEAIEKHDEEITEYDYGWDINIEQESLEWAFVKGEVNVDSWDKFCYF